MIDNLILDTVRPKKLEKEISNQNNEHGISSENQIVTQQPPQQFIHSPDKEKKI